MDVGLFSGVSAIALVGYVGAVTYQGNLYALTQELPQDWRFLEWAVAVGVLYYLARETSLSGPITGLIALAIVGLALKHTGNVTTAANDLSQGNLFKSIADLAGVK